MGEPGHRLGFVEQRRPKLGGSSGQVGAQKLHRNLPIQLRIVRGINDRHSAPTDTVEQNVSAEIGSARQAYRSGLFLGGRVFSGIHRHFHHRGHERTTPVALIDVAFEPGAAAR